ncbi:hypothetical protein P8452_32569 [Trifolium repens]|nr:hypothetical protein P8452_32569 [Trifolium repens]
MERSFDDFFIVITTYEGQHRHPCPVIEVLNYSVASYLIFTDNKIRGHEGKFSIYIHSSKEKPVHASRYFVGREIHSEPISMVSWGSFAMIEAERRLLANALLDPDNQHFVLLSDSCIPIRRFEFVYKYLLITNVSFIECYIDPGPHGNRRYIEHMWPEVEMKDFRKGSQWFSMKRQHAIIVIADSLYFTKFKHHCRVLLYYL